MSWQLGPHPDDAARPAPEVPGRMPFRSVSSQVVMRPRADTRAITVVELLPLAPGLVLAALTVFSGPFLAAAWGATAIASLVFAMRDRATLDSRGFGGLVSPLTALVHPLLYIVLRGRACRGLDSDAMAPLPWAIGATVLGAIGIGIDAVFFSGVTDGLAALTGIG